MKTLLISLFACSILNYCNNCLSNSAWTCTIANTCVDSLKFTGKNHVTNYSCELGYTFQGSYSISKNLVTIIEKDDSHGGKAEYSKMKFMLKGNALYPISNEELVNGKWAKSRVPIDKKYIFKKIK